MNILIKEQPKFLYFGTSLLCERVRMGLTVNWYLAKKLVVNW